MLGSEGNWVGGSHRKEVATSLGGAMQLAIACSSM